MFVIVTRAGAAQLCAYVYSNQMFCALVLSHSRVNFLRHLFHSRHVDEDDATFEQKLEPNFARIELDQ